MLFFFQRFKFTINLCYFVFSVIKCNFLGPFQKIDFSDLVFFALLLCRLIKSMWPTKVINHFLRNINFHYFTLLHNAFIYLSFAKTMKIFWDCFRLFLNKLRSQILPVHAHVSKLNIALVLYINQLRVFIWKLSNWSLMISNLCTTSIIFSFFCHICILSLGSICINAWYPSCID